MQLEPVAATNWLDWLGEATTWAKFLRPPSKTSTSSRGLHARVHALATTAMSVDCCTYQPCDDLIIQYLSRSGWAVHWSQYYCDYTVHPSLVPVSHHDESIPLTMYFLITTILHSKLSSCNENGMLYLESTYMGVCQLYPMQCPSLQCQQNSYCVSTLCSEVNKKHLAVCYTCWL